MCTPPHLPFSRRVAVERIRGHRQQGIGHMLRHSLVILVGLGLVGSASAGSWADSLFEELGKDFGSVPRGPTLTHPFHLTNNTKQVVTIGNLRVSCGCTTVVALKNR